jgi:hypothetical protein
VSLFVSGSIAFGFAVAALFFRRFWQKTRDRLFLLFAYAFAMMSVEHVVLATKGGIETWGYVYLIRLGAYLLIIDAIVDKNRSK